MTPEQIDAISYFPCTVYVGLSDEEKRQVAFSHVSYLCCIHLYHIDACILVHLKIFEGFPCSFADGWIIVLIGGKLIELPGLEDPRQGFPGAHAEPPERVACSWRSGHAR